MHFGSLIISIFGVSWNRRFKGTYFLVAHFMHFGGLKMLFLPSVKVVWTLCRHFGDFRIRFLLSRNTKSLRVPSFLWSHFLHFVGLKMRVLLGRVTHSFLRAFWRPEISIDVDSWKHGSRVPRTVWAHFRFFGGLKTPYLTSCVTHGSRDRSFLWALVSCRLLSRLLYSSLFLSRLVSTLVSSTLLYSRLVSACLVSLFV